MNHARARLWIGITSVGTVVVLSTTALALDLPARLPGAPASVGRELGALWLAFLVYTLVQLPFDVMGGLVVPRRYGRSQRSTVNWIAGWARGVVVQAVWTIGLALTVLQVSRAIDPVAGLAVVVAASLVLVAAQGWMAARVGGLRERDHAIALDTRTREWIDASILVVVDHDDVGFTGGWIGWPGRERLLVPAAWMERLRAGSLHSELVRRAAVLHSGARVRGLILGLGFNLVGFALAAFVLGGSTTTVAGLVTASLWFTLWSFLGTLILPSLSRPAVYGADRAARDSGVPERDMVDAARQLDRWQDDEPRRAPGVERIFHPIPAVEHRVDALRSGAPARAGAWHTARMALFLGWATFGLLGRAVHCNCGRPELWVLLPAD